MRGSVHNPTKYFQLEPAEDQVSREQGNGDGLTHCGDRVYSIVNAAEVSSFLTLDGTDQLVL